MKRTQTQLEDLLDIYAPSGEETPVRQYLEPLLMGLMDEVFVDSYGNLLGTKKLGDGLGATVLLSAHMDTVKETRSDKIVRLTNGVYAAFLPDGEQTVLGADDRAGIAVILSVLRNLPETFNGTLKVAFTREEERGCIGSEQIDPAWYREADLAIVADRKGDRDIVVGCMTPFCSTETGLFFEEASLQADLPFECVEGGMSDAYIFSSHGVNSVNLSVGYYGEHTPGEELHFYEMMGTVALIRQVLSMVGEHAPKFGAVPTRNAWISEYHDMAYDEEDDWLFMAEL